MQTKNSTEANSESVGLEKKIVSVDVGCKFGIHPSLIAIKDLCNHYLIDADELEISRLSQHYVNKKNINLDCYFIGHLSEKNEKERLYLYSHSGGHSKYLPDEDGGYWKHFRKGSGNIVGEKKVNKISLDKFSKEKNITPEFLKIDVEGAELEVLDGANHVLSNSILGVRIEVLMNPLYKDQEPTFGDVDARLRKQGFQFLFFDKFFTNSYTPFSDFYIDAPYGQLGGCDAIYVLSPDNILDKKDSSQILNYVIFCFCNNATDLAMHILMEAAKQKIYKPEEWQYTEKYRFLEKSVATLLFKIQDRPGNNLKEFAKLWELMFVSDWINYGDFYKRFPLT